MIISDQVRVAAWEAAQIHKVDFNLLLGTIMVESSGNTYATRFEKHWAYFKDVDIWAFKRRITENTERTMQMMSWGLCQVMGAVARELGFDRDLPELTDPKIGAFYGAKKLAQLSKKHTKLHDVIASYNAGIPKILPDGRYANQNYVDKVVAAMGEIQRGKQ